MARSIVDNNTYYDNGDVVIWSTPKSETHRLYDKSQENLKEKEMRDQFYTSNENEGDFIRLEVRQLDSGYIIGTSDIEICHSDIIKRHAVTTRAQMIKMINKLIEELD
jgi:hypothetical protein